MDTTSSISSGDYSSQTKSDLGVVQQSEQIQEERLKFDTKFLEFLGRKSFNRFIVRALRQFKLDQCYQEVWVLNEAYIRGVGRIATGEVIQKPIAWLRSTAFKIIRELSREHQKSGPLEEDIPDAPQAMISSVDFEDDFTTIMMAFQLLSPHDKRLLNLKINELCSRPHPPGLVFY